MREEPRSRVGEVLYRTAINHRDHLRIGMTLHESAARLQASTSSVRLLTTEEHRHGSLGSPSTATGRLRITSSSGGSRLELGEE